MRIERFYDCRHGNGLQFVFTNWTLALRLKWHLKVTKPKWKPGYTRVYLGPLEVEHRKITE